MTRAASRGRRIRTGVVERIKSVRHPSPTIWEPGVYLIPTPYFRTELREMGAPVLWVDTRDGSTMWQGRRLEVVE